MERWRNKVAVVSGASAGIGAACTQALLQAGLIVVGLARRQERIEQLRATLPREQQQRLHAMHCDMRQESQVQQAIAWTQRQLGGLHVLVSNAGIIAESELSSAGNTEAMRRTIETNIMGTVYGVREAFQLMRQQGERDEQSEGHVVIVNSVAGQQVPNLGPQLPSLNIYPASKFALRAMQEIYRQEFQRHKTRVRVSVSVCETTPRKGERVTFSSHVSLLLPSLQTISPGMVDTDILPQQLQGVVKQHMPMLRAQDVAEALLWTIGTPPNVQVS